MSYGKGTSTLRTLETNDDNADAILNERRWDGESVTFGFTSDFRNDYEEESGYLNSRQHIDSFQAFSDLQQQAMRRWVANYESVLDFKFIELSGSDARNATIRIANSDAPSTAYAYYPAGSVEAGDVWFNTAGYNNPDVGDYEYLTMGHELGHALGLEHGHETGGIRGIKMDANRDSMEFSVMTYRSYIGQQNLGTYTNPYASGYAQSLMMYDIKALQAQYGANFAHNAGDTTYRFSPTTGEMFVDGAGQDAPGSNRIFLTLWDGDGTDTYDFSNYQSALSIDLAPGGWSDLDVGGYQQRANLGDGNYARAHVFNALQIEGDVRSLIENAQGGDGDDSISGNAASNDLRGQAGDDSLFGADGDDVLSGDAGDDQLRGDAGDDLLKGGSGNDILIGGDGDDRMLGGAGDDEFWGERGNHVMNGGGGTDSLNYEFWNGGGTYDLSRKTVQLSDTYTDTVRNFENITTGNGDDTVIANAKDNRISTGAGADDITGDGGDDSLFGGAGNDVLRGGNGDDDITGDGGDDYLLGGDGSDVLRGGNGDDYLNGAGSNAKGRGDIDLLISGNLRDRDTFVLGEDGEAFYANRGNADYAIIQDFVNDTIQLAGSAADYSLQAVSLQAVSLGSRLGDTFDDISGVGIHFADDLIGLVQNIDIGSLALNDTSQFSYV